MRLGGETDAFVSANDIACYGNILAGNSECHVFCSLVKKKPIKINFSVKTHQIAPGVEAGRGKKEKQNKTAF